MKVYGAGVYLHKKDHKIAAQLALKCFEGCVRWSEDFCWWWHVYCGHNWASLPTKQLQAKWPKAYLEGIGTKKGKP